MCWVLGRHTEIECDGTAASTELEGVTDTLSCVIVIKTQALLYILEKTEEKTFGQVLCCRVLDEDKLHQAVL